MDTIDRYRGSLLGLATGDAVGTALEFKAAGSFDPISDMVGGGPFHLEPGQWTDDTSMAICLAESLIECRGFDPADQMRRYVRWWREGHLSSTGRCFDIGNTTKWRGDPHARHKAASALGAIGNRSDSVLAALRKCHGDSDPSVQEAVALALRLLSDPK